jgi:hypothetical protein
MDPGRFSAAAHEGDNASPDRHRRSLRQSRMSGEWIVVARRGQPLKSSPCYGRLKCRTRIVTCLSSWELSCDTEFIYPAIGRLFMARKYSKKASADVKRVMKKRKAGTLKSGRSGKKVTSRKQAIAIGLSEARAAGKKVPKKAKKKTSKKKSSKKRTTKR